MKHTVAILGTLLFLAACATSQQNSGPNVTVHLEQLNTPSDVFYFSGPVNIQYRLTVTNPTDQPITLSRLELQTLGPGAYSLHTSSPMNIKVPTRGTTSTTLSAWAYARGGYLASTEPVTLRATAYFTAPSGPFVRIAQQNIMP
jgi:hypothetical protein